MCSSPLPMKLRFSGEAAGPAAKASEAEEQRQRDKQQEYKQQKQRGKPRDHPAAKASSGGSGSGAAKRPQGSGGGKQLVRSGQQSKEERRHRGGTSLTAVTALGTVAVYAGVRGGIAAFHHARRHFLTRLLHDLSAALHALNATWWLDFGSLLGIYRDGELILHDNDIDLSVLDPDWPALLQGLRQALPQYSMRLVTPSEDPSVRFLRVYCPLGMADVFGAHPVGGAAAADAERLLVECGHGACTEIGRPAVLPTGVMTWRGSKISVPGDVPAALEQRYGAGWRVPRYMDKGADVVEGQKLYARIFRALGSLGIRI